MKDEIVKDIDSYVELYDQLKQKFDSEGVALTVLVEIGKNKRVREMAEARRVNANATQVSNGNDSITPKQAKLLKDLRIAFDAGMTKRQASEAIDNALKVAAR